MKKEINIDSRFTKSILLGFIISIVFVFFIERNSKIQYVPNIPNSYSGGKIELTTTYYPATTPVLTLNMITPFGTNIDLPTKNLMCSDLQNSDSKFNSGYNMNILYLKALLKDFKYMILIWMVVSCIFLFFYFFKLKFSK